MNKQIILIFTLFCLAFVPACNLNQEKEEIRNVILDVDTSVDDMMAILYLLTCPGIRIKAITISHGVADVDTGTEIVLRMLSVTGHGDIPVARGGANPLEGDNAFPKEWQPDIHRPFGLSLPAHSLLPVKITADSLIAQLLTTYRNNISILALGPMTNIARCFLKHPELAGEVKQIYVSDGAVNISGAINLEYPAINNRVSGWNQWVDPKAADVVFNSGSPVKLVPLDLTALHSKDAIVITKNIIRKFNTIACSSEAIALKALMNHWIDLYNSGLSSSEVAGKVPVWDVVAVLVFHHPEIATDWKDCNIQIAMGRPETDGQILVRESEQPKVRIYLKGNQVLFDSLFLQAAVCNGN